ncbi:MAG: thioredoxin fold domain-containing protein [Endozoicomonadaceae bacterium]|nr:thioredoxin fold domain-containing protein [Endozoicomonadaceae bacterium]
MLQSQDEKNMLEAIHKIADTHFSIQKTFQVKPYHLTGYVLQPKDAEQDPTILYTQNKTGLIFLGAIFDITGNPLTEEHTKQHLFPEFAKKFIHTVSKENWFLIGSPSAPHQVYFIGEPNCTICHRLYLDLKPFIEQKKLAIRWIMVSFIDKTSLNKAAAILQAKDPVVALNELHNTEVFKPIPDNQITESTQQIIQNNLQIIANNTTISAPILFFIDHKQRPIRINGYPSRPLPEFVSMLGRLPDSPDSSNLPVIPEKSDKQ